MDWQNRREIIRTLVKRVEIDQDQVNVVFRVEPHSLVPDLGKDCLQHCTGRAVYFVIEYLIRRSG
jgi:site-specific DNA recombinase